MGRGKIAAQCAHAAVKAYSHYCWLKCAGDEAKVKLTYRCLPETGSTLARGWSKRNGPSLDPTAQRQLVFFEKWNRMGQAKIALKVKVGLRSSGGGGDQGLGLPSVGEQFAKHASNLSSVASVAG